MMNASINTSNNDSRHVDVTQTVEVAIPKLVQKFFHDPEIISPRNKCILYKALNNQPNETQIVRYFKALDSDDYKLCMQEIVVMMRSKHPNVLPILSHEADPSTKEIIYSMPFGTSLETEIDSGRPFSENLATALLSKLLEALDSCL